MNIVNVRNIHTIRIVEFEFSEIKRFARRHNENSKIMWNVDDIQFMDNADIMCCVILRGIKLCES